MQGYDKRQKQSTADLRDVVHRHRAGCGLLYHCDEYQVRTDQGLWGYPAPLCDAGSAAAFDWLIRQVALLYLEPDDRKEL